MTFPSKNPLLVLFIATFSFFLFPPPAQAQVDCRTTQLSSIQVFIPPFQSRTQPSGIRIVSAPEPFYDKTLELVFTLEIPEGQSPPPLGPPQYIIPFQIDSTGNADLTGLSINDLDPSIPSDNYTIQIRGGIIGAEQLPDGSFQDINTLCFEDQDYSVQITGDIACLELGADCSTSTLPPCNPNAFCDPNENTVRVPDLQPVILGNANCAYAPTPGDNTCADANQDLSYTCSREYLTPQETTLCCASQAQCRVATGEINNSPALGEYLEQLCAQAGPLSSQCRGCFSDGDMFWSAIGCVPSTAIGIATAGTNLALGVAGGFGLIFILLGSFMIATSAGQPNRLQSGRDLIISAIMGLLIIVLSISILEFLGVHILHIPGF